MRIGGRRTTIGLGRYPVVTRAKARAIAEGSDPHQTSTSVPTFAKALETAIAVHAENWKDRAKSEQQSRASLRDYAMPRVEDKPVNEIDSADVMAVLLPIWSTKRVTAQRVRVWRDDQDEMTFSS